MVSLHYSFQLVGWFLDDGGLDVRGSCWVGGVRGSAERLPFIAENSFRSWGEGLLRCNLV